MFKIRIVWNKAVLADKAPYEAFAKRTDIHGLVQKAMHAYPNNEIKTITITAAVVDVLLDDQLANEAKGRKDV